MRRVGTEGAFRLRHYQADNVEKSPLYCPPPLGGGVGKGKGGGLLLTFLSGFPMFKKLLRAIHTVESFDLERHEIARRLERIESVLDTHSTRASAVEGNLGGLEAQVSREVLNMAELYGKTYRLLKRMQAEDRYDAEEPPEPDIAPTDPVTERVMARRRHGVSKSRTDGQG